jgi:hypothetical protein
MTSRSLEQILGNKLIPNISSDKEYKTIDVYVPKTIVLYTPPIKIYDLPNIGVSIHLHGSSENNILYGGDIRPIGMRKPFKRLNSYEAAMADYYLSNGIIQGTGKLIEPKKNK